MIKELHIFDFDGTLVDSSHRYRTKICDDGVERIDLKFWIENENKALMDKPLPLADNFRKICKDSEKFSVIATARIWCPLSVSFAYIQNLIPNGLVARKNREDCRSGGALKANYINKLLNLKQFKNVSVIHIYEDNFSYLSTLMEVFANKGFRVEGHFYPSNQGY